MKIPAKHGEHVNHTLPLFRVEAVDHFSASSYGNIFVASTASSHLLVAGLFAITLCLAVIVGNLEFARKETVHGVLVPTIGVLKISSSTGGTIISQAVAEGSRVSAGQILFILSTERAQQNLDSPEKLTGELLLSRRTSYAAEIGRVAERRTSEKESISVKIRHLRNESLRLQEQIGAQEARVELSQKGHAVTEELERGGFFSAAQVRERKGELLDQRQRLADLRRSGEVGMRELSDLYHQLDTADLRARAETAEVERKIHEIDENIIEIEARRESVVRAPHDGVLSSIGVEVGQFVSAGAKIGYLLPIEQALEAEVYVPTRSAGFIKPGMDVLLRYHAFPFQKFGQHPARVKDIALTTLVSKERSIE